MASTGGSQVPLKDFYFLPSKIMLSGGIDNILRQMNQQKAQEVDTYASAGVRNFLFGERNSGGADLGVFVSCGSWRKGQRRRMFQHTHRGCCEKHVQGILQTAARSPPLRVLQGMISVPMPRLATRVSMHHMSPSTKHSLVKHCVNVFAV